jgi:hypothetical protein
MAYSKFDMSDIVTSPTILDEVVEDPDRLRDHEAGKYVGHFQWIQQGSNRRYGLGLRYRW